MFASSRLTLALFIGLFSVLLSCAEAIRSPLKLKDTLVLYDPAQLVSGESKTNAEVTFESQYSKFTQVLESRELSYEILSVDDLEKKNIKLTENSHLLYQNVFIFPSKAKELSPLLQSKNLVEFVNLGGDVFTITKPEGSQTDVVLFLNELGIYPSPKNYQFVDYFNTNDDSDVIKSINNPKFLNDVVVPSSTSISRVPYTSGSVALLSNNELLIPILAASRTSVSFNSEEGINFKSTWHAGSQGFLIAGFQALNNARVMWCGSDSFFKDTDFNQDLVENLIDWTFQISGLVKITSFKHENADTKYSENYKIKDDIDFEIGFSQWDGEKWIAYDTPEGSEIQLEFIMLDPYYRLNLEKLREETINGENSSIYGTSFKIPDQHGMFTFDVNYKIPGLSYVESKEVVSVRHLANDEYPRSWEITNSWVYLASAIAVVIAWFLFVSFFIFSREKPVVEADKKTN